MGDRTPFLKFYSGDWIAGTLTLTFEQKGFYLELLLRMWERKEGLPADERWIAAALRCNPRTARKIIGELIAASKLTIENGMLVNSRMMRDIRAGKFDPNPAPIEPELEANSTRIEPEFEANEPKNDGDTVSRIRTIPNARLQIPEESLLSEVPSDDGPDIKPKTAKRRFSYTPEFDTWWASYPDVTNNSKAKAFAEWRKLIPADRELARMALGPFGGHCKKNPDYRCVHAERFLRDRRFESWTAAAAKTPQSGPNAAELARRKREFEAELVELGT